MAKNIKKHEEHEEYEVHDEHENEDGFSDFSDFLDHSDTEPFADIMSALLDTSKHQMTVALELTRLAVESTDKDMSTKEVFAAFKEAYTAIAESFPMKALMEKMNG